MWTTNSTDFVYFGRSQCSRQHAFAAFVHAGVPDADARRKADALPRVSGPVPVAFASSEPTANAYHSEGEDGLPAAIVIASDTGMDPTTFRDRLSHAIGVAKGLASEPREVANKALESLDIDPKSADPKYMAEALRLATPTASPDSESAGQQATGYAFGGSARRKVVVIGSIAG
ncbi:MAG TPA: hypothetical protein VHR66_16285 [Gemmataceae bacterium]|jgi:hypothetical protein|nr:hypothetical protein [Gemmataceae bacterium]